MAPQATKTQHSLLISLLSREQDPRWLERNKSVAVLDGDANRLLRSTRLGELAIEEIQLRGSLMGCASVAGVPFAKRPTVGLNGWA